MTRTADAAATAPSSGCRLDVRLLDERRTESGIWRRAESGGRRSSKHKRVTLTESEGLSAMIAKGIRRGRGEIAGRRENAGDGTIGRSEE